MSFIFKGNPAAGAAGPEVIEITTGSGDYYEVTAQETLFLVNVPTEPFYQIAFDDTVDIPNGANVRVIGNSDTTILLQLKSGNSIFYNAISGNQLTIPVLCVVDLVFYKMEGQAVMCQVVSASAAIGLNF